MSEADFYGLLIILPLAALFVYFFYKKHFSSHLFETPSRPSQGCTPDNPVPLNTPIRFTLQSELKTADVSMTITEVKRGAVVWKIIQKFNPITKPPEVDKEYLLARIRIHVITTSDNKPYKITKDDFIAVSGDGIPYRNVFIFPPKPRLQGKILPGEVLEGWCAFLISKRDPKPLLMVKGVRHQVWFMLY